MASRAPAWQLPSERAQEGYWREFQTRFSYSPAPGLPIDEPAPSMTLDLSSVGVAGGLSVPEADERILDVLVSAFPDDARLIAIKVDGPVWFFWPHRFARMRRSWPHSWKVFPYPNGQPYAFLTERMNAGIIAHPGSVPMVCFLGESVVREASVMTAQWPVLSHRA